MRFFFPECNIFRSSHRRYSVKKGVLKNFANFKGKHLCWSLFLIKLQAWRLPTLLQRSFSTDVFLLNLRNFKEQLFWRASANGCFFILCFRRYKVAIVKQWVKWEALSYYFKALYRRCSWGSSLRLTIIHWWFLLSILRKLCEKCPNTDFLWSIFSRIQYEYGKTWTSKNPVLGHFSRSGSLKAWWIYQKELKLNS